MDITLANFKHMYSFRLVYYLLWYIVWDILRLQLLYRRSHQ
jgi:hypothetical protein